MLPRTFAIAFTVVFMATALTPLVTASTEPTHNGDVIINGAFRDAKPIGHPMKFYCDANNPTPVAGPGGECARANRFIAFDWTTPLVEGGTATLGPDGIRIEGNTFIQQHFNGSDAPDRLMQVFHVAVTGQAAAAGKGNLRVEIRADGDHDGVLDSYGKTISFGTSLSTIDVTAAQLGIPPGVHNVRSVRLWADTNADLTIGRASVYATNGIDARNLHIISGGDDVLSQLDGASLLNAGADGKYTFLAGIAADNGEFLPARDAFVCLYTFEQATADRGFPDNVPTYCAGAYLDSTSPSITKTREGDAFRFDIDARAIQPVTGVPAFALYAIVMVDGSYDIETPTTGIEAKTGYYNAARVAADLLDAGVSEEYFTPTPLFIDANADGKPDYVSTQDMDGYSVIITPQLATHTPALSVVTTDLNGDYLFDVQVYKYDGATGAPLDLPGAISLGLFNAESVINGGSSDPTPFWRTDDHGSQLRRIDAKTWRVVVPASDVPANAPVGAWAFYNVGQGQSTNVFGRSTSSTDFFSGLRNSVKEFAVADALRTAMTPLLLEPASRTRDATFVIRMDPSVDDLTPLDGTLVAGDMGDGRVTFEYAMVIPEGRTVSLTGMSHGLALYDAAGAASDGFAPGASDMKHALWTGKGVLQPDGWFRLDVPVSAFTSAKGSTGAWGWTDTTTGEGTLLSRSGWYNLLKPLAASMSTSAAEAALYAPTPITLLDAQLGIPKTLSSAIAGAGSDLISVHNPLVNPGFEADLFVEGHNDARDNTGGTMTAPPWFLRLDDKGTGQPTIPRSTHSVEAGKGRLADHALKVNYHKLDQGKALMLGQILGSELGGDALIWRGATAAEVDVQLIGSTDVRFTANLRWIDADGVVHLKDATKLVTGSTTWNRHSFPLSVPADGRLLGFYLVMDAAQSTTIHLDNLAIVGAKTALGEARTDLTDGYAIVIEPQGLSGVSQSLTQGAEGKYYVYTVKAIDYTHGSPATLDLTGMARAFALRTEELQHGGGILLPLRGRTDAFAAIVGEDDVPADLAVPWAFVDAGPAYATLGGGIVNQPASGHYNPAKNAIAGLPLADQLDHAATPVRFASDVGVTQATQQSIRLTSVSGGYAVIVAASSPYVEATTLTVSRPGESPQIFAAPLTQEGGDIVPGLVLTNADLQVATLTTANSRFTRGATLIAGSPIASFEICRPDQGATCIDVGAISRELLTFKSTSVSPTGEPLTQVWRFGDASSATGAQATHAYNRPGVYTVNLTVQTPSGKQASYERALTINNQAPTISGMDVLPSPVYVDSPVRVRVRAGDADGGILGYAWQVDGVNVPGASQSSLLLTRSVLENTTGIPIFEKREYVVSVMIADGQGGVTNGQAPFTVLDKPTTATTPAFKVVGFPAASYALPGEVVRVSVSVSDNDDIVTRVVFDHATPAGPGSLDLVEESAGVWVGTIPVTGIGAISGQALAMVGAEIRATSAVGTFQSRADALPIVTITGANVTDVGRVSTYTVSAVDPDGRGIVGYALSGATVLSSTGNTFEVRFDDIGTTQLIATAMDATGAVGQGVYAVLVDDSISVEVSMLREAEAITEGHLVQILVTDVHGAPIAGASVIVEDFYDGFPTSLETREFTTDADGLVIVEMRPEGVLIGLPFARTVVATASAASDPAAPIQDTETAVGSLAIRNAAGPLGGLPLP